MKKYLSFLLCSCWFLLVSTSLFAVSKNSLQQRQKSKDRPPMDFKVHNVGEVWSVVSNFGIYGDPNWVLPGYDWPGGTDAFYLWEGRVWVGAIASGETLTSCAEYGGYEWMPSEETQPSGWVYEGSGTSMQDIICIYDDWDEGANTKPLGLKIIQKAMSWSVSGFDDFIAYEYKLIYDGRHGDKLTNLFFCICFDDDCGGRVSPDSWLDDLVSYDGWTNGEWEKSYPEPTYPYDKVTLNPDGTIITEPDGIYDQFTIFGDEPQERTLHGDTLIFWRNVSYCYDGDNPARPEDDTGEDGKARGYLGGRMLYAPPSPRDSIWVDEYGDTCRFLRPHSHTWWNWETDPGSDKEKYRYMLGTHNFCDVYDIGVYYKFMPHPFDSNAPVFDYRFLLTYGPYEISAWDTLEFVFAGIMGYGLDGGDEDYWRPGQWIAGLRHNADNALKAYYMGSQHSDPFHPSTPSEDIHWLIPMPPEVPNLVYSAGLGCVTLTWDDIAECIPDPLDKKYDFRGYRVYKSKFRVGEWELVKGFVDADFAGANPDSFPQPLYDYIEEGETFSHSYVDRDIIYGVPYFYAVTSFDSGRDTLEALIAIPSLESGKTNYKKTPIGAEIQIFAKTEGAKDLSKVTVAPNPYLGSVAWENQYENRIQFMNLPGSCRILIYTLSGDLVRDIVHRDGSGDEYWDLLSRNEQEVMSGLYVYKIETDDGNYKIGKLMILR